MEASQDFLDRLISSPSESLNVEVKSWIDPKSPHGIAKIAVGCMALRNRNGGYLIFGFDDETLQPDARNRPASIEQLFHVDAIQSIVSRYSSIPFEVTVGFAVREGLHYPVLMVDSGVTVPVAAKRPLLDGNGKPLIKQDAVYFRTLNSNGTPSSSPAVASDWRDIVDICFDNREADIGRFLRRHLGPSIAGRLLEMSSPSTDLAEAEGLDITSGGKQGVLKRRTIDLLKFNDERRERVLSEPEFAKVKHRIDKLGSWSVMLVIDPPLPHSDTNAAFLNSVATANPQYSGWPVWLDARGFRDGSARPRKVEKGWDTILISLDSGGWSYADFYRIHAKGEFYMWRVLQDDLSPKVEPSTVLDPGLMVYRVAEVVAVGLAIAKAIGAADGSLLGIAFRWRNLRGRTLESWTDWRRMFSHYGKANDKEAEGYVEVPVDTPQDAIAPVVQDATRELFGVWGGFEFKLPGIEQLVEKLLSRKG